MKKSDTYITFINIRCTKVINPCTICYLHNYRGEHYICNEWATLTILSNPCHSVSKSQNACNTNSGCLYVLKTSYLPTYKITNLLLHTYLWNYKPTTSYLPIKLQTYYKDTHPWCVPSKTYLTFTNFPIIPSFKFNTWLLN